MYQNINNFPKDKYPKTWNKIQKFYPKVNKFMIINGLAHFYYKNYKYCIINLKEYEKFQHEYHKALELIEKYKNYPMNKRYYPIYYKNRIITYAIVPVFITLEETRIYLKNIKNIIADCLNVDSYEIKIENNPYQI